MRYVYQGLGRPFEKLGFHFIQQQSQYDRRWKIKYQIQYGNGQCVYQQHIKVRAGKQISKMIQSHPGAACEALIGAELLERDHDAKHRQVLKNDKVKRSGHE